MSLHGREVQLTTEGQQVRELIEAFFQKAGYQAPSFSDLQNSVEADPEEIRRIFFWMIKEKILVKLSDDLVYHRTTLDAIKKQIKAKFAPGAKFGVADFKELFDYHAANTPSRCWNISTGKNSPAASAMTASCCNPYLERNKG